MILPLPKWYFECAEDYLSILRSSQDYTQSELFEATKKQRLAEYKVMKERMNVDEKSDIAPVHHTALPTALANLHQYTASSMYTGHFQANKTSSGVNKRGTLFWENVLK